MLIDRRARRPGRPADRAGARARPAARGKALFFGAAVAARRGDLPLARQRFAKLLSDESAGQRAAAASSSRSSAIDPELPRPARPAAGTPPRRAAGADAAPALVRVTRHARARARGERTGRRRCLCLCAIRRRGRAAAGGQAPGEPVSPDRRPDCRGLDDPRARVCGRPERAGGGADRALRQPGGGERRPLRARSPTRSARTAGGLVIDRLTP